MKILIIIFLIYAAISILLFLLQLAASFLIGEDSDQSFRMKVSEVIKYSLQWPYFVFKIFVR